MFRKMRRAPRSRPEREDRGPLSRRRRPGIYVLAAIGALTVAFLLIRYLIIPLLVMIG
ncbi:MAG: hypothetical protein IJ231_05875 [Clostridia bacterium]|nr:hypothetical protein [Clostridia bacterium]